MPSAATFTTELVSRVEEIDLDEAAWHRLTQLNDTNTVFQTRVWFDSWWTIFGRANELFFVKVLKGDHVVGFAPLMISREARNQRVLRFACDSNADYCDIVAASDKERVAELVLDCILAHRDRWDTVVLKNIPERSRTMPLILEWCGTRRFPHIVSDPIACPALVLDPDHVGSDKASGRYSLRRPVNLFSRKGELRFVDLTDAGLAQSYLDPFFDQHVERWRGTRHPSLFLDPDQRAFYAELLRRALPRGLVLFSAVLLGETPLAFHYGFDFNDTITWYKPSFNVHYAKGSPGLLVLKHLIDYAARHGRHEVDFTIGDEPFKQRYANTVRYNRQIEIFKNPRRYLIERALRRTRRAVKRAFAQPPFANGRH